MNISDNYSLLPGAQQCLSLQELLQQGGSCRPQQSSSSSSQLINIVSVQRAISDSVLTQQQRPSSYSSSSNKTVNMSVYGSGVASTVKEMVEAIQLRCFEQENDPQAFVPPPEEECFILGQWANDSYYKVVIAGRQGIPAIVRAMKTFPSHASLQECCCLALGNLCAQNGGNLIAVESAGGVTQIIAAMKNHPRSVALQSVACDALRNMSGLILAQKPGPASPLGSDLIEVLSNAKEMYLPPTQHAVADILLTAIRSNA